MTKYILLIFFLLLLSGISADVFPQTVRYIGIDQGLSNNSVGGVYKDHNGFMWFSTYDGLNKYDGTGFTIFRNRIGDSTSILSNTIGAIEGDLNNNIWVVTSLGLCIYYPATDLFSRVKYKPSTGTSLKYVDFEINLITVDNDGTMYVSAKNNGLLVFDPGSEIGYQVPLMTGMKKIFNYPISATAINQTTNDVWLFIENVGLCKYNKKGPAVQLINNSIKQVNCMIVHKDKNLWLGNNYGLAKYNPDLNNVSAEYDIGINKIKALLIDNADKLWLGSDGKGILIMDLATEKIKPLLSANGKGMLNSISILDLYQDEDDRIWICTIRGGINVIDVKSNPFSSYLYKGDNDTNAGFNSISAFCEDIKDEIWLGTSGWGLRQWNRKNNTYRFYSNDPANDHSLGSNLVTNILRDAGNDIWISAWYGGVNRFDRATRSFTRYPCFNPFTNKLETQVWFLHEDRYKTIWAGTSNEGTLYFLNRAANRFEVFDKRIENPQCIAEDKSGNLWVGTYSTLIKVDKVNKKHIVYQIGYIVRSIHEDSKGNFWIGTQGGGLLLFNRQRGTFKRYNENTGLHAGTILRIEEDAHSNLWMSSFTGLIKFNTEKKQFSKFTKSDGLLSNQFNSNGSLSLKSGEMMFGGINGFHMFNPDSIDIKESKPTVFLTHIQINGQPISENKSFITKSTLDKVTELTVPFDKAYIALEFVAPEYSAPDKIQYSYFMEGLEKAYRNNYNARSAVYSQMNEGTYYFNVKTTNVWGVWGKETQLLKIIILPPWYRSWWAYLLYSLTIAGIFYLYAWYKKNREDLKFKIILADLQVKKEEELNERKLSFFTNIAHEFRTPLTLIINPIKDLLNKQDIKEPENDLNIIYRNAKRLMSLVNQLLLFRKAENETAGLQIELLNFAVLCKEVFLCFVQQALSKDKQYEFICADEEISLYADREKMEVCLFNLISNAMKYTAKNGKVSVKITQTAQEVLLSVEDDGAGIPPEVGSSLFEKFYQVQGYGIKSKKGFGIGLYLVKKFIELHKGTINYTTTINKGTIFTFRLLKGNAHFEDVGIFFGSEQKSSFLDELVEEPEITGNIPVVVNRNDVPVVSDKMVMLVIDDNEQIRNYLVKIFNHSFKIQQADNGDDGLKMTRQFQPDIIISDIRMPGVNGIDLCRLVKTDMELKHIPFILLTGSSGEEARLRGIECGADDYINKPFEKELLLARVNSILQNRNNLQQYFFNEITHRQNTLKISREDKAFIDLCISIVENNLGNDTFNIKIFAAEIGMSHSNLYKRVKAVSGQSINSFIRFIRLRKAAELLINTPTNVNEVAFQVGINDIKYFRQQFFKLFQLNPSDYIKKYRKSLSNSTYRFNDEKNS